MKNLTSKIICTAAAVVACPVLASAQADANSLLTTAKTTLSGLVNTVVVIVEIIMGLIGAVMLAVNLAKYFKEDGHANDALMKIGGGLLIAVIILQVLRMTLLAQ